MEHLVLLYRYRQLALVDRCNFPKYRTVHEFILQVKGHLDE